MYDVIIIGGGPAGATLARLIGKKFKVFLLEKRAFSDNEEKPRIKCCGGLIAPDAQLMLAKFGLGVPKTALLSPQLFSVRTIDFDNSIERDYQRDYINIDREKFDQWLEDIIPSEVDRINNCLFRSYEEKDDHVLIKYVYQGEEYEARGKLLVGADGASSKIRRQGFKNQPSPRLYVAIQEWFETNENLNYYGAIFDREISDFYSWTIPKENYLILGTAVSPSKKANQKFDLLKEKMRSKGFNFDKSIKKNGAYILRPTKREQICPGNKRIALIGEAAGFISPSSAEGLSYAFRSSLALAKSLKNGVENYQDSYLDNLKPLLRNISIKNIKSLVMYNSRLRKLIMDSGLLSIDIERIGY